jgi:3-oxoacyl-[acyl-carrier protein] reductase
MDLQLEDSVAIVTGSSRGLGLASAKALAAEGCRVVLTDLLGGYAQGAVRVPPP